MGPDEDRQQGRDGEPPPVRGSRQPAAELSAWFSPPPLDGAVVLFDRPKETQTVEDRDALTAAGALVFDLTDLDQALAVLAPDHRAVVVLDLSAPAVSPHQLAQLRHRLGQGFCIVVGHNLSSAVRTRLLLGGADDSLASPYLPEELVARVAALLRRRRQDETQERARSAGLHIDVASRTVRLEDVPVTLTQREFDLLAYFLDHPDVVLTRERILSDVWGYDFGSTATVTVHVRRLRGKVEAEPGRPQRIVSVRGIGYLYRPGNG